MGTASIQVHLTNPGQVFACLGFLEAADALCGPAEGGFMWDLAGVQVTPVAPANWTPPQKDKKQLWDERREELIADPFHTLCPMGGSFNFDARLAWTALDAGFSPDEQDQKVVGSPVVELFAAWDSNMRARDRSRIATTPMPSGAIDYRRSSPAWRSRARCPWLHLAAFA